MANPVGRQRVGLPDSPASSADGTNAPRGTTATFLFTDIEGSTRRWEAQHAAMSAALARHDALVRAAIEAHDGRVFKTVGDAFCAAFEESAGALSAALAAQRALLAEDWSAFGSEFATLRARMAIHTGVVEARDGDFFGPPVNRVARLLAAGHGGQILVSRVTEELAEHHLPAGASLRDLGEHRLKDLDRPERVFQLEGDGLPADFPPLRTLDRVPGNLPVQLTSFVGRAEAIADVGALVAAHRLVTVTGIGGTGKTRLALQVAAELADAFPDGAWFVDLAPLVGDEAVAAAAASTLGAREDASRPTEDVVAGHLRDRRALLILDNCEHVIGGSARLAAAVLRTCPNVRILATSREPLAIEGETLAPLAPLETPALLKRAPTPADLARFAQLDAVQLFIDRATAVQPAFRVDAANAPAVAQICHRLDGIPLAIELAAARVRALSPAEIARRLDQRFRLLTGGHRDRLPRQRTLQAAIDWSYDLLPEVERRVLERFSVFAGAVPMAAAEAVCAGGEVEDVDVLDAMDALVGKSLVVLSDVRGETWYRLLDTVRAFAEEKLAAGGGERDARSRHLDWYIRIAIESGVEELGSESDRVCDELAPLANDLSLAIERAIKVDRHAVQARRAIGALWWLLFRRPRQELSRMLAEAVDCAAIEGAAQDSDAVLYWFASTVAGQAGKFDESLDLAATGLVLAEASSSMRLVAWLHKSIGTVHGRRGELAEARSCFLEAARIEREQGDWQSLAFSLSNLGEVARMRGELAEAIARVREALAALPASERHSSVAAAILVNQGQTHLALGELDEARSCLRSALRMPFASPENTADCLAACAGVADDRTDGARGVRLLGAATALLHSHGLVLEAHDTATWERSEATTRALVPPSEWDAAFAEGLAMTVEEAIAYALDGGDTDRETSDV